MSSWFTNFRRVLNVLFFPLGNSPASELVIIPGNYPEERGKVKCTLVQALKLCTGRTAHRGSRGIALLFHDHGTRTEWGVSVTSRPLFTHGKDPVPIVPEAGWAPGPVWTGAEILASTGIRSPVRPARSQSLYRLSYPAHTQKKTYNKLGLHETDICISGTVMFFVCSFIFLFFFFWGGGD